MVNELNHIKGLEDLKTLHDVANRKLGEMFLELDNWLLETSYHAFLSTTMEEPIIKLPD